jgi:hypothetical protein
MRTLAALLALWALLIPLSSAQAAVEPINLTVGQDDVGFMGIIKPGVWNAIRLTLENPSAQPMAVQCRWTLNDFDKDVIIASRHVTVPARRKQTVWVYGCVPVTLSNQPDWKIDVIESETRQVLATKPIVNCKLTPPSRRLIALSGNSRLGLNEFTADIADSRLIVHHQELTTLARGLESGNLPDRWYGYDTLDTLILTPEIEPTKIPVEVFSGLRDWIKRGGHLVIVMPSVNEAWSQSPGKDFLPEAEITRKESQKLPIWLGGPNRVTDLKVDYYSFAPKNNSMGVIYTDDAKNPIVVSRQLGFGAVTVIGLNITDGGLEALGLPNGQASIWHKIFGWRSPPLTRATLESLAKDTSTIKLKPRGDEHELDTLLVSDAGSIKSNIQLWAVSAIIIFGVYWILAGPVSYLILRVKKKAYHSWVVFLGIVLVFSAGVWALAWLSRPKSTQQNHFTFYDYDLRQKLVRCQSWAQINCPDFARQDVALDPGERGDSTNTIGSPGMVAEKALSRGWVDVQTIDIDAGAPNKQWVPFRSSAKLFQLRYMGKPDPQDPTWPAPTGTVVASARTSGLTGILKHQLPGTLSNVVLIYCPGAGASPECWNVAPWAANTDLNLASATAGRPVELVRDANSYIDPKRTSTMNDGITGSAMQVVINKMGSTNAMHNFQQDLGDLGDDTRAAMVNAISFFDALPPPLFIASSQANSGNYEQAEALVRTQSRSLDLTKLTTQPKLIVIGHLIQSPNPTPITLDGERIQGSGRTVVRYIFEVR